MKYLVMAVYCSVTWFTYLLIVTYEISMHLDFRHHLRYNQYFTDLSGLKLYSYAQTWNLPPIKGWVARLMK